MTFCRDDPDERVETILLIVSNASLEEDLSSKIDLEPESKPCVEKAATLTMNATYTADAKFQDNKTACQDHITLTYSGSAHYQLLPFQTSKDHVNADLLTTRPGPGVQSERSGNFTVDVQGGGSCGNVVWKYFAKTNMVAPDRFPTIAVRLRSGHYGLDQPNISTYIDVDGQMNIPGHAPIPLAGYNVAMSALATLEGHSSQKVDDALQGSFPPFSKRLSNSNHINYYMDINDPGQGTASLNISYTLAVSRK